MSEMKTPQAETPVADEGTMRRIKKLLTLGKDASLNRGVA